MSSPTRRPDNDEEIRRLIQDDPFVVADWYQHPDDDDVCEALVRALADPSGTVRYAAVRALVGMNDLYASSSIYGVLAHGTPLARLAAIEVVERIGRGDALALRHLTRLATDGDTLIAERATRALASMAGDDETDE
jgi:HEAT repeat protein